MKHTFEAQGLTFTKSSWSDTDWTKQCVGVGSECLCHAAMADSVTEDIIGGFPHSEMIALFKTVR